MDISGYKDSQIIILNSTSINIVEYNDGVASISKYSEFNYLFSKEIKLTQK